MTSVITSIQPSGDINLSAFTQLLSSSASTAATSTTHQLISQKLELLNSVSPSTSSSISSSLPPLWNSVAYNNPSISSSSSSQPIWYSLTSGNIKKFVWKQSAGEKWMLTSLDIDAQTAIAVENNLPVYAASMINMGLLEPTQAAANASTPSTIGTTNASTDNTSNVEEQSLSDFGFSTPMKPNLPPQAFTPMNGTTSNNNTTTTDMSNTLLDFSMFDTPQKSTTTTPKPNNNNNNNNNNAQRNSASLALFDEDFLGLSSPIPTTVVPSVSTNPIVSLHLLNAPKLSDEAKLLLDALPDLSYMHSTVLMFPANLSSSYA